MGEAVIDPLHAAVGSVKDSGEGANLDPSTTLFHRRIEFHLARKPFTGFARGGNSGFKLETLNPGNSNSGSKSEAYRIISGSASGSGKASEENNSGLDPELSFRITFRRIGAGLQNLGNTCFLNSVLQCLTYTEPLAAYLQSGRHKISCRTAGFCALCAIQNHVSRALESTGRILAPKDLVSNLRCISRKFRIARQEDAHEYMVNLLESMHKCCLPSGVPSESPSAYEKSLVHKIFGGRLRSQVKCLQCSFCSNKFDPFLDLSLEIVKADSLFKALAHFTAKEQLDGGEKLYQCQQCKEKVKALKQLTVYKAPQVLTIHLKRFSSHSDRKIDRRVEFGPTLDLKPFVTDPTYDGDLKYTLYGVLVHAGWSTHSGHYYCFVRTSSGIWYTLDDNKVYQVSERQVLQQKAYMLFYVRDRRNIVTKKTVDVIQKESMATNPLGSKGYNNLNHGLKETIQNEFLGKKLNDSISAAAQKDSAKSNSLLKGKTQMDYDKQVNGIDATSGCSALKKNHSMETSLKVPAKADLPNGYSISNLTGGNGLLHSVSSPGQSNGSLGKSLGVDGISHGISVQHKNNDHQDSSTKDEKLQTNCNGNQNSGKSLDCLLLKRDHSSETLLEVPPKVGFPNVSPISASFSKECGNILSHVNSLSTNSRLQSNPTANIPMQHEGNDHENSTVNGENDSTVIKPTSIVNPTCSGKGPVTANKSPENGVLQRSSGEAPDLNKNSEKDEYLTGSASLADLAGPNEKESSLFRKKASDSKFGPVRRRPLKYQVARMLLSSNIIFGATLGRKKKRKCRSRRCSSGKQDGNSVLLDLGPSTSDCSGHLPSKSKSCPVEETMCLSNVTGNSDMVAANQDFRNRVGQDDCVPSSEKQTSILRPFSSEACVQNGPMSMLTRGLEETTVARWDGLELPQSEFVDSRSTESVKIGYVGDEWDEEYDRGKRKKIRNKDLTFGGPNPFQEISVKKDKMKKQKLNHSSSANQPFRI